MGAASPATTRPAIGFVPTRCPHPGPLPLVPPAPRASVRSHAPGACQEIARPTRFLPLPP
jgi:hypothetical protein